jgi:hypothetical protein
MYNISGIGHWTWDTVSFLCALPGRIITAYQHNEFDKVQLLVGRTFTWLNQCGVFAMGIDDSVTKGLYRRYKFSFITDHSKSLKHRLRETNKYITRGALFVTSGVIGMHAAWQQLRHDKSTQHFAKILGASYAFFIAGHLVNLDLSLSQVGRGFDLFFEATTSEQRKKALHEISTATMGVLISLSYIIATALTLFELYEALAITLGGIATFTRLFQSLYDYYFLVGSNSPI